MNADDVAMLAKDAVSQGGMVWTATQITKGLLKWNATSDVPNALIQTIAAAYSLLVGAASVPRSNLSTPDWLLQVMTYGLVIILPIALAGHTVAAIGRSTEKGASASKEDI